MHWDWIPQHYGLFAQYTVQHVELSLIPVVLGLLVSLPLGIACVRWRWLYPPVFGVANLLYTIPSVVLFLLFAVYITGISSTSAIIPLALFTLSVLIPNVRDGLVGVPESVRQAAVAVGFGPSRRLLQVELPIAVPVIAAGVRVATVASISLASLASTVSSIGGYGQLFVDGSQRDIPSEIVAGIALTVVLALVVDFLLVTAQRLLTPWSRARQGAAA